MKAKEVLSKEKILGTVIYRMMNKDANAELLTGIPHICILNLAAVYYCILNQKDGDHIGLFINDEICQHYGISKEELDSAARRNTEATGFTIQAFSEMLGMPEEIFLGQMYVITNQPALYGASSLLYEDYFRSLADQVGEDLYILPSSIHELIAIPAINGHLEGLQDIVREVNGTKEAISPHEILSNNVYIYSQDNGLMRVTLDDKRK